MRDFAKWIEGTRLSGALLSDPLYVPLFQTVHIAGLAVVGGAFVAILFKLWRDAPNDTSASQIAQYYVFWIYAMAAILLVSGTILLIAEPVRSLTTTTLWVKLPMVAAFLVFCEVLRRKAAGNGWGKSSRHMGAISLLLVILIVIAGRWIAYSPSVLG